MTDEPAATVRALRFREHGEPADVLHLETVPVPEPGADRIRVTVSACGLTPADWALCRGLFSGPFPRGIGIDVAGVVDAVGASVTDIAVGDLVFGTADWAGQSSAGAADAAIMDHWFPVPDGLGAEQAAALPMAVETAHRGLAQLDIAAGQTVLVHAAGTTVGFAAVQIALLQGASVIATAGPTNAARLTGLGARVTPYGAGMVERVRDLAGGPVDRVLDTSPVSDATAGLVAVAGDADHVLSLVDPDAPSEHGTRDPRQGDTTLRFDVIPGYGALAAAGRFSVPIAASFPLAQWRDALDRSLGNRAGGKLLLLPHAAVGAAPTPREV